MIWFIIKAIYIGSAIFVAWKLLFPIKSWKDLGWGMMSVFTPIINTCLAFILVGRE